MNIVHSFSHSRSRVHRARSPWHRNISMVFAQRFEYEGVMRERGWEAFLPECSALSGSGRRHSQGALHT
eukprot:10890239-Alexandrium_andersonii.AAC.1